MPLADELAANDPATSGGCKNSTLVEDVLATGFCSPCVKPRPAFHEKVSKPLRRRAFVKGTAAGFASIALVKSPAKAAQFQYKVGTSLSIDHPLAVRNIQLWSEVKKETQGRLQVKVFPSSSLGSDPAMLTQVRSGALEFANLEGGIIGSVLPLAQITNLPFAYKNRDMAFAAFDGELGEYVRKELTTIGVFPFPKLMEGGFRQITSSTKPIRTPVDMEGFRIRAPAAPIFIDCFRSLGAAPTAINFNEVYTALQTHIVDGQETPLSVIETSRIYEVQRYLSLTNHMWGSFFLLCNQDAWRALPQDIQEIVLRNHAKYALLERRDLELSNATLIDKLHRQGLAVNTTEPDPFRAKLPSYYAKYKAAFGNAAWALLEKYVGKLG